MCPRVHIDGTVRHLDVGSSYPGGGEAPKGMAVRHLKRYASWVQTVEKWYHVAIHITTSPQSESSEEFRLVLPLEVKTLFWQTSNRDENDREIPFEVAVAFGNLLQTGRGQSNHGGLS